VHLVCFIIRIYHDARSCECQIRKKLTYPHLSSLTLKAGGPVRFVTEVSTEQQTLALWHRGLRRRNVDKLS